jgi:hypothetical protein
MDVLIRADLLTGLLYGIIKVLAFGGLGLVFAGIVVTGLCDLFDSKRWKRCHGQTNVWQLMH